MSHFFTAVIVPQDGDPEKHVERLLAPYDERLACGCKESRWDGWVIGGRWDGAITGVGPETREIPCDLCRGTGRRKTWPAGTKKEWIAKCGGCNGCHGTGRETEYLGRSGGELARNICPVADRDPNAKLHVIVTPDGEWHQDRLQWDPPDLTLFDSYRDGYLVVGVDCHV